MKTGQVIAGALLKSAQHTGKEQGVCFKLPVASLNTIRMAAQMEHRSMSNFMWHHAVVAAERIVNKG